MANTGIDILLIEDLIGGLDSIDEIQTAIHKGIQNGLVTVDQAAEVAQVKISQLFEPTTDNITEVENKYILLFVNRSFPLLSIESRQQLR